MTQILQTGTTSNVKQFNEASLDQSYNPDIGEAFRDGPSFYFRAATWAVNPKITKESLKSFFKTNPRNAWREYGSVRPKAIEAFCKDPDLIKRNCNYNRMPPMDEKGVFQPWFIPNPDFRYFMHVDLGYSRDSAGFCMAHPDPYNKKVVIDLMVKMIPPENGVLQFDSFSSLILSIQRKGFDIEMITFDQWQSVQIRQFLGNRGLNVGYYSVDRTNEAYDTLLEMLLLNRLDYYWHDGFDWEFHNLNYINGKVDHKVDTQKDLSDAVAGAVFHCVNSNIMGGMQNIIMGVDLTGGTVPVRPEDRLEDPLVGLSGDAAEMMQEDFETESPEPFLFVDM